MPDKAIDLLDEAASRMRIERSSIPKELDELIRQRRNKEIELESIRQDGINGHDIEVLEQEIAIIKEKEDVLKNKWQNERIAFEKLQQCYDNIERLKRNRDIAEQEQRFSDVVSFDRRICDINNSIIELINNIKREDNQLLKTALDATDIMDVVTTMTGIPISKLKEEEAHNLLNLESVLSEKIIGQKKAIEAIANVVRRNKMGLNDAARPIGSFLFLGSTGVGKTELTKALSEYLFNSRDALIRIDMSEYQQEHSVARLFGAPPGYVGYEQAGQLTEAVRRKPYSIVLFDEIEKAHPKVFETLLQVLDDGRMTDGQGRTIDFKNTIIIMTSNIGQDIIREELLDGIINDDTVQNTTNAVMMQMKSRVAPEFINRIDEIIMFLPLTKDDIKRIVCLQLNNLRNKLEKAHNIHIDFGDDVIEFITEKGYVPEYGARPVKRAIDVFFINELSQVLLDGNIDRSKTIQGFVHGHDIKFQQVCESI